MYHKAFFLSLFLGLMFLTGCNADPGQEPVSEQKGFTYENELYHFEVAADGAWISFKVNGVECIVPEEQGSGYLGANVLEWSGTDVLSGEHQGRSLVISFRPEEIEVEYFQEGQRGVEYIRKELAEHFKWAVFPRINGRSYMIPAGRRLDENIGARFLSRHGVGFEMHDRTYLAQEPDSWAFGTYIYPKGKSFKIIPVSKIDPADLLLVHFDDYPENHFFEAGEIVLPTKVENTGDQAVEITVFSRLETYNTNAPGELIAQRSQDLRIGARDVVDAGAVFEPVEPGPYKFVIALEHEGREVIKAGGTMIYDEDNWSYPDLEPEDFDEFWAQTLEQLRSRDLDVEYEEITDRRGVPDGFKYVSFNGLGDHRVRGLIAIPDNIEPGQKVRGRIGLPGAGYAAAPPDHRAVERGEVMLAISIHDMPFGGDTGRHHPEEYWFDSAYQELNLHDRNEYYYRYAYAAAVRAVDYLRSLDFVDPDKIVVGGGSQGGSLAMVVAGLTEGLESVSASVPGRIRWDLLTFKYRANCSFEPPAGMTKQEMFDDVLAYFDCGYFARRISVPFTMHIGLADEINPGVLQYWGFREIPETVEKTVHIDPWGGH